MQADAELVRAVLAGNHEAFAILVARHERAVWTTAWRVLRDRDAAADAAQDSFVQAFQRLGDLRRPDRFGVWLLRITRREAVRQGRLRAREPGQYLRDEDLQTPHSRHDPSSSLSTHAEDLLDAVAALPDHERLVVALRYLDGCSVAEIANVLDRPVSTVTKQLSRAIQRLKTRARGAIR